jgi:hypothetical protein
MRRTATSSPAVLMIDELQGQGYQFLTVDELLRINTAAAPVVGQP